MRDEMWNVINLTHYPQRKIYFYLSCPDFLAPAEEEKAWVMLAYITPASVITAKKKKKKKKDSFPPEGFFSEEPQNCDHILQMFSMYLVKEKQ